mgnify:CR=1 FL=1
MIYVSKKNINIYDLNTEKNNRDFIKFEYRSKALELIEKCIKNIK